MFFDISDISDIFLVTAVSETQQMSQNKAEMRNVQDIKGGGGVK